MHPMRVLNDNEGYSMWYRGNVRVYDSTSDSRRSHNPCCDEVSVDEDDLVWVCNTFSRGG